MSIKESALSAITSIAQSDFVRAVTAAGASRRVTVANLAKAIIESYTGSSLAGTNQSVKAVLDALDSKTSGLYIKKYGSNAGTTINIGVASRATMLIFSNDNGGRHWLAIVSTKTNSSIEANIIVHDSTPEYDPTFSFANNILTVNCHSWENIICLSTSSIS